jgi:hypothetical protein
MVLEGPSLSRSASPAKTQQEIRRSGGTGLLLSRCASRVKTEQEIRRSGGTGLLLSRCASRVKTNRRSEDQEARFVAVSGSRAKTDTANQTREDSVTARKEIAPDLLTSCALLAGEAKRDSQKRCS